MPTRATRFIRQPGETLAAWKARAPSTGLCQEPASAIRATATASCQSCDALLIPGIERPRLGPVSTGLGEVFHYVVRAKGYDFSTLPEEEKVRKLTELRTVQDWIIKPQLRTVRGTAQSNVRSPP